MLTQRVCWSVYRRYANGISSALFGLFVCFSGDAQAAWGPWVQLPGAPGVYWRAECLGDSDYQGTWQWNVEVRSALSQHAHLDFTVTDRREMTQSGTWLLDPGQTISWGYRFRRSCDGGSLGARVDNMTLDR